ncbi:MAG: ABC transporter substrate-binding protein [Chloroflexota bacterium]
MATALTVLAACGGAAPASSSAAASAGAPASAAAKPSASSGAPDTVRFGSLTPSASDAGWLIANAKGYFAEQRIKLEISRFSNGSELVPPLGTNQLDVGGGAPNAGLFNAVARDVPLLIVADKGSTPPGYGFQAFVVRKDLMDSGKFKSPADLKGMKVALPQRAQSGEVSLVEILKSGGLKLSDVDLTVMPFPEMSAAYANKNIDASTYIEPFITNAVEQGFVSIWQRGDQYTPNQQVAAIQFAPQFAKNTDLATRFMVAYLKGVRLYNDAFAKKDPAAKAEVVDILARETTLKDKALYDKMGLPGLNPNGTVNVADLKRQQDYYLSSGQQKNAADLDKVVDGSFVAAALKQLGAYK